MENELIVRMLKEFVVELNQKWIHPDICEKGAVAIEALMTQNQQLRSAIHGICSACEHYNALTVTVPCQNCLWYSNGCGLKDNWQLREELSAPNSTPDNPLSGDFAGNGGKAVLARRAAARIGAAPLGSLAGQYRKKYPGLPLWRTLAGVPQ